MDILSSSSINSAVNSYKVNEQNKRVSPLLVQKNKYSSLSSVWGQLSSKLSSLQTYLTDLKSSESSSVFNTKTANLSSSSYFTVSTTSSADKSSYSVKVNQLAKADTLLSDTRTSNAASGVAATTQKINVQSGDYSDTVEFTTTGSETYSELMTKISSAINSDKASLTSTDPGGGPFTKSGSLKFNVNGTETELAYNYENKTYSEMVTGLIDQINSNVSGLLAEDDGGNLKISVIDSNNYLSISDTSGTLGSDLGINATNKKAASALMSASVFTPTSGNSKFSITSKNSGYDNRLVLSDASGTSLASLGLTNSILSNHTLSPDESTAGFKYSAVSATNNELNSKISFNGISVQRNTNTINDLVTGLTFNLKAEMSADTENVTVTVGNDNSAVKSKIEGFISSFNDAYKLLKSNYYSGKSGRGIFVGDPTAISLMNEMKNLTTSNVDGIASDKLNSLADLGISFSPETGLSITDSTTFSRNLDEKMTQVTDVFNSANGVASKLYDKINSYVGVEGSIANLTSSLDKNVTFYSDRIKYTNETIDKGASLLRKQYEKLQTQYAQMLNMASFYNQVGIF